MIVKVIEKITYERTSMITQKNEKENKNIKYSDSIELFNIDDVNK